MNNRCLITLISIFWLILFLESCMEYSGIPCANFKNGDTVQIIVEGPVNIRRTPGHINKPLDDIITECEKGFRFQINGERKHKDGICWWKIKGLNNAWIAQNDQNGTPFFDLYSPQRY